jgi:hypothetical protein
MAEENRGWGIAGIEGALSNLGHKLARSAIDDILVGMAWNRHQN